MKLELLQGSFRLLFDCVAQWSAPIFYVEFTSRSSLFPQLELDLIFYWLDGGGVLVEVTLILDLIS